MSFLPTKAPGAQTVEKEPTQAPVLQAPSSAALPMTNKILGILFAAAREDVELRRIEIPMNDYLNLAFEMKLSSTNAVVRPCVLRNSAGLSRTIVDVQWADPIPFHGPNGLVTIFEAPARR